MGLTLLPFRTSTTELQPLGYLDLIEGFASLTSPA
jgi:hypothetical protein